MMRCRKPFESNINVLNTFWNVFKTGFYVNSVVSSFVILSKIVGFWFVNICTSYFQKHFKISDSALYTSTWLSNNQEMCSKLCDRQIFWENTKNRLSFLIVGRMLFLSIGFKYCTYILSENIFPIFFVHKMVLKCCNLLSYLVAIMHVKICSKSRRLLAFIASTFIKISFPDFDEVVF